VSAAGEPAMPGKGPSSSSVMGVTENQPAPGDAKTDEKSRAGGGRDAAGDSSL